MNIQKLQDFQSRSKPGQYLLIISHEFLNLNMHTPTFDAVASFKPVFYPIAYVFNYFSPNSLPLCVYKQRNSREEFFAGAASKVFDLLDIDGP